jgi:hypothetical protein
MGGTSTSPDTQGLKKLYFIISIAHFVSRHKNLAGEM